MESEEQQAASAPKEVPKKKEKVKPAGKAKADGKEEKKAKPAKKEKAPKVKKAKQEKPHPSSKAGPGFTVKLNDEDPPRVVIATVNKKGYAGMKLGLKEGDVIVRIDNLSTDGANMNVVKSKLIGKSGDSIRLGVERVNEVTKEKETVVLELILDFSPLVKSMKAGKLDQRGKSTALSLHMVDTQMKRELFYLAGAMQPLCKLLTDGKAAAQLDVAIRSLQNMMKVAMWDDLSVALTALGKPLVQLVERGGLAKRMMAMDLLVKIALFAPTHDALVASGLIEVICLQPKGVIPAVLPKETPKGWKAGKKPNGLEGKAAGVLSCLARMEDGTRRRINDVNNKGVHLLVRMMKRTREAAGKLNAIGPDAAANATDALQYMALNSSCRHDMHSLGALETLIDILNEFVEEAGQTEDEVHKELEKYASNNMRRLTAPEFESWYANSGRGDARKAKATFRTLDIRGEGTALFNDIVKFVLDPPPQAKFDLFAMMCIRNVAVEGALREKLISLGAVEAIAGRRLATKRKEKRAAAVLALLNLSFSRECHVSMQGCAVLLCCCGCAFLMIVLDVLLCVVAAASDAVCKQHRLLAVGIEDKLVSLLGNSEEGCATAMMMRQLASTKTMQKKLIAAGVMKPLIDMMKVME
ncbi:hypothetical protein GUITHDRAFT_122911 [Guillardia theta CCMP2712]|uniref:PDZ domain-containing protein n=1 Tax=Guillardia theta (strain CCMP2712) TaxID=905079 RepID=L1I498_GUITC|nr:hypothetical protein GUITHDRAFT_122911 [Guillardia theta CCMP2712]EKX30882.1 hypothetical protein GUITHDRAFT_122911 [Guillardia theta CCMP2712]|eukprot:XP_005817862.1 hypothetical protein GUITHDRAFT_122911 [Guillardia theta CCMP2712]